MVYNQWVLVSILFKILVPCGVGTYMQREKLWIFILIFSIIYFMLLSNFDIFTSSYSYPYAHSSNKGSQKGYKIFKCVLFTILKCI